MLFNALSCRDGEALGCNPIPPIPRYSLCACLSGWLDACLKAASTVRLMMSLSNAYQGIWVHDWPPQQRTSISLRNHRGRLPGHQPRHPVQPLPLSLSLPLRLQALIGLLLLFSMLQRLNLTFGRRSVPYASTHPRSPAAPDDPYPRNWCSTQTMLLDL